MRTTITHQSAWDTKAYASITSAAYHAGALTVGFEDGSEVVVDSKQLVPWHLPNPDWTAVRWDSHEIVAPSAAGDFAVPWDVVRRLTDPAFAAYWADMAVNEARAIGLRLTELRQNKGLTIEEVAARAGSTPAALTGQEAGEAGISLRAIEDLLAVIGESLDALAVPDEDPIDE